VTSRAESFRAGLEVLRERDSFRFPADAVPDDFGRAAVLVAFWPDGDDVRCLLTRRSTKLSSHQGQVAFPGGRVDPGETWHEAAVREAQEEVGLDPARVEVIGDLDDAWSGARIHIVPVVAWVETEPQLAASPFEVDEILLPRLSELLDPKALTHHEVTHQGRVYQNRTLAFEGGEIYGLSTDMLIEALDWGIGEVPERGPERLSDLRKYYPTSSS
jgi:8-oxo-dGTP pyrophosphatase MutT (NUDIX family)